MSSGARRRWWWRARRVSARRCCGGRGWRRPAGYGCVLTCRGVEAEASLSFSGLSELLAPVLDEVTASLAPPRRRALEVALLLVEPGEAAPDAHAIGLAVLDVLRVLAARAPLVVAVDDAQWLDPASAAVLQIALRRLRGEPVGVLITVREAPGLSVPIELDRCFDADRLRRLAGGSAHRRVRCTICSRTVSGSTCPDPSWSA